jgi:hypothetical protein
MAKHKEFTVATDVQVYFCDPQSPWQRGTNENTNLLLRQYFPRGTDLSVHSQAHLDKIALRLNQRPRKTLGFQTPASKLQASVASTVWTGGAYRTSEVLLQMVGNHQWLLGVKASMRRWLKIVAISILILLGMVIIHASVSPHWVWYFLVPNAQITANRTPERVGYIVAGMGQSCF